MKESRRKLCRVTAGDGNNSRGGVRAGRGDEREGKGMLAAWGRVVVKVCFVVLTCTCSGAVAHAQEGDEEREESEDEGREIKIKSSKQSSRREENDGSPQAAGQPPPAPRAASVRTTGYTCNRRPAVAAAQTPAGCSPPSPLHAGGAAATPPSHLGAVPSAVCCVRYLAPVTRQCALRSPPQSREAPQYAKAHSPPLRRAVLTTAREAGIAYSERQIHRGKGISFSGFASTEKGRRVFALTERNVINIKKKKKRNKQKRKR